MASLSRFTTENEDELLITVENVGEGYYSLQVMDLSSGRITTADKIPLMHMLEVIPNTKEVDKMVFDLNVGEELSF